MVVRANIVKNQTIGVDLNQKAGGFSAPVKSVNSKTGDVVLNANDVGAISKDELQATANEILAQAKESGDFDGPQGPQGEKGEKGDKGDTGLTGPQGPAGSDANVTAENIDRALGYTPADRIALEELARRLNALADSDDVTLDQISELVAYIKANRSLIESVTTNKVNVSDIINNLTTNVANRPLSAAQGVALKSLIDALQTLVNGKAAKATTLAGYGIVDAASKQELSSYGKVKTVNYMTPDANGNINVEGGSGKESDSFEIIATDTLEWNGDTDGRIVVEAFPDDPSYRYIHVSNTVPTMADLQNGGSFMMVHYDNSETEEPFTISDINDVGDYIKEQYGCFFIAKKDGAILADGYDVVLPKAGVYFLQNIGARGQYVRSLTINNYKAFTKSILKMENLTAHAHDWYGKPTNKGNTLRGDDTVHGGLVKVSNATPTLAEVQKGGTIRIYHVRDNKITGDLIVENYLESPWSVYDITSGNNKGILIASDGLPMVHIKSDGVYFRQDSNICVHSLTINGYTEFPYNVEPIPSELLPDDIGSDVDLSDYYTKNEVYSKSEIDSKGFLTSVNYTGEKVDELLHKIDTSFSEETINYGSTLTWDGNTDGLVSVMGTAFHVSSVVPTLEDLQNGGTITMSTHDEPNVATAEFTIDNVMDVGAVGKGSNLLIIQCDAGGAMIATEDNAYMMADGSIPVSFPKAGIYLMGGEDSYCSGFTINNYQFVETKIKTIDKKFLPEFAGIEYINVFYDEIDSQGKYINPTTDGNVGYINGLVSNGKYVIARVTKVGEELYGGVYVPLAYANMVSVGFNGYNGVGDEMRIMIESDGSVQIIHN